jgi:hypothetical protein
MTEYKIVLNIIFLLHVASVHYYGEKHLQFLVFQGGRGRRETEFRHESSLFGILRWPIIIQEYTIQIKLIMLLEQ